MPYSSSAGTGCNRLFKTGSVTRMLAWLASPGSSETKSITPVFVPGVGLLATGNAKPSQMPGRRPLDLLCGMAGEIVRLTPRIGVGVNEAGACPE
jgi:hypothetical protein